MTIEVTHYRGRLTPKALAQGINAARRNAFRLAMDAKLMLAHERYPSAAAFAALAIEEAGKVAILRGMPFAHTEEELQNIWRDYRRHRAKNGAWLVFDLLKKTGGRFIDVAVAADKRGEHTALLDAVKKLALYTECLETGQWSEPDDVAPPELAAELVRIAEILARPKEVTVREMELWVEHLQPAWNKPTMPQALIRWAAAMQNEGLPAPSASDLQKFFAGKETLADMVDRVKPHGAPPEGFHEQPGG